jgi:hypothetical protein
LRHLGKAVATRTLSTLLEHTMRPGKQGDANCTLSLAGKKSGCAKFVAKIERAPIVYIVSRAFKVRYDTLSCRLKMLNACKLPAPGDGGGGKSSRSTTHSLYLHYLLCNYPLQRPCRHKFQYLKTPACKIHNGRAQHKQIEKWRKREMCFFWCVRLVFSRILVSFILNRARRRA